jgi:hypothetical protein
VGAVLETITFDHDLFKAELIGLGTLLQSKADLSETDHVQPERGRLFWHPPQPADD